MNNRGFRQLAIPLSLLLLVAACGGETSNDSTYSADNVEVTDPDDNTAEVANGADDDTPEQNTFNEPPAETDSDTEDASGPNIYEDPRGGIYLKFQQGFDRGNHPFAQYDSFCLPHEPAANRVDTGDGITADFIKVGHIRSRLEDLIDLGFAVPVGDPKEMFEVFIDYINNECGGIRGRMLDLGYTEAILFGGDVEASRNAACVAMTEDHQSVIVMNSTGFQGSANLCLVEEQETLFISIQGQSEEFMDRSNDLLLSLSPTLDENLAFMVSELLDSGAIEGMTLGVAAPNTPGQAETVERALVAPLREAGFDVVFDVIDCGGSEFCTGGVQESVANMVKAGVNGFFNVLNAVSAPGYISEMANQGYTPGDVHFFATDFNTQTSELVAGLIANNVKAGNLYNGATIIDFRSTGEYRDPNYEPNPMEAGCNQLYSENSPSGTSHDWQTLGSSAYHMVSSVCAIVRIMARALYDAGDNPTIADVREAIVNLGPVDNNAMTPASIRPGKTQMADAIQTLDFSFPCDQILPFIRRSGDPICITGHNDFRFVPR